MSGWPKKARFESEIRVYKMVARTKPSIKRVTNSTGRGDIKSCLNSVHGLFFSIMPSIANIVNNCSSFSSSVSSTHSLMIFQMFIRFLLMASSSADLSLVVPELLYCKTFGLHLRNVEYLGSLSYTTLRISPQWCESTPRIRNLFFGKINFCKIPQKIALALFGPLHYKPNLVHSMQKKNILACVGEFFLGSKWHTFC